MNTFNDGRMGRILRRDEGMEVGGGGGNMYIMRIGSGTSEYGYANTVTVSYECGGKGKLTAT